MKSAAKKMLSLLLSALTVFALLIPVLSVLAQENVGIPTIYIMGQGDNLYADKSNTRSEQIYPLSGFDKDYILGVIDELNPVFLKALVTGNYTDYCDVIYNAVEPIFTKIRFDDNGENSNGSGIPWTWTRETLKGKSANGEYGLFDYHFRYDWRLDPCEIADELDRYIQDVMAVTEATKVNIVSRCLGCNIAMAYLTEYGNEDINKCVFYCSVAEGTAVCNDTFSGNICIDSDAVERFVFDFLRETVVIDETVTEFIKTAVPLMNKTGTLNLVSGLVNCIYQKVKSNIVPRLLLATFGTFPSYWSMVDDKFEQAKELVFGDNTEQYAGLIEKIDNYHYNVQANIRETLKKASESTDIAVIAKYGYQLTPVVPGIDEVTDGVVELTKASFGATTATVDKTFNKKYLAKAVENGTEEYISPDGQVDASTCLFPDSTWFIKRIKHKEFPGNIDDLILRFLRFDGRMTVTDDKLYPQYMMYDRTNGSLMEMTSENSVITDWETPGFFTLLGKFSDQLPVIIEDYLKPLLNSEEPA